MNGRVIISILGALAAGGATIYFVQDLQNTEPAPMESQSVSVVVAARDLQASIKLDESMLGVIQMAPESAPPGFVTDVEEIDGRVLRQVVPEKFPITNAVLAPEGTPPGMAAMIPPGYRAKSIKVNEVTSVAGFITPQSYVDVHTVIKDPKSNVPHALTILKNVRVLAVGQSLYDEEGRTTGRVGRTENSVTLQLTPEDVDTIVMHENSGNTLSLSLRSGDSEPGDSFVDTLDAMWRTDEQAPKTVMHAPPPAPEDTLERFVTLEMQGNEAKSKTYVKIDGEWWDEDRWQAMSAKNPGMRRDQMRAFSVAPAQAAPEETPSVQHAEETSEPTKQQEDHPEADGDTESPTQAETNSESETPTTEDETVSNVEANSTEEE